MRVILLANIKKLGHVGEEVKVRAGYSRNYLIPQGKALPATAQNRAVFEAQRAEYEKSAQEAMVKAQEKVTLLEKLGTVQLKAKASDEGKLFGSVGTREIAAAVSEKGVELNKSQIDLPSGPIRELGEYDVVIYFL